ncbi:hypothetical protein IAD21_00529 [Abditibacteriota bacterium]|nr:hypothetical protein IAD21_00529 [Abditibacteriota bacterium]
MPAFHRSWAFIIGINDYCHGIPPLHTAAPDARELAHLLEAEHGYTVQLLTGDVTVERMRGLLQRASEQMGADDQVIFYFAGHGIPPDHENRRAGYLVPQNARRNASETYLPMDELYQALLAFPCRHLLLILDCCFAGAFRWAATRETRHLSPVPEVLIYQERFHRFLKDPAWQLITSAAHDQKALDVLSGSPIGERDAGQKHSPFAQALLEGLRGKADRLRETEHGLRGDGVITATELYTYVEEQVARVTAQQTVELWPLERHDKGQYIFFVPGVDAGKLELPTAQELKAANNPYLGLQSYDFTEEHSELFFGRNRAIQELEQHVQQHPLAVVLGASGTGKSSLVKAGLLSALNQRDNWQVLSPMRPGSAPVAALAALLIDSALGVPEQTPDVLAQDEQALAEIVGEWRARNEGKTLLLCIDQFEELLTQDRTEKERNHFCQLLYNAVIAHGEQFHVVLTVRSDFEPRFAGVPPLNQLWDAGRYPVAPMRIEELRQAIIGPATARVLFFDPPDLVDDLIGEVSQSPGALPLLSFTLSQLYLECIKRGTEDRRLTRADFNQMGRVIGSLSNRANALYDEFKEPEPAKQETLRRVMLRLVDVEGPEVVKRRVPFSEFIYKDEAETRRARDVIDRLVEGRLLVTDIMIVGRENRSEPCVEPAHDALVHGWNLLGEWLEQEQKTPLPLSLQRRLTRDANDWHTHTDGRQDLNLWHNDSRLFLAEEALDKNNLNFNQVEQSFLIESVTLRKKNLTRRKRITVGVAVAISLLSSGFFLSGFRYIQAHHEADLEHNINLSINLTDTSQTIIKQPNKIQTSILLSLEAIKKYPTVSAFGALEDGWDTLPDVSSDLIDDNENNYVNLMIYSPNNRYFAVSYSKYIKVWDTHNFNNKTNPSPNFLIPTNYEVTSIEFSPDSYTLAIGTHEGNIFLINTQTGKKMQSIIWAPFPILRIFFSPNGQYIAMSGFDYKYPNDKSGYESYVYNIRNGIPLFNFHHDDNIRDISFNLQGNYIATGGRDGYVNIWQLPTKIEVNARLSRLCNKIKKWKNLTPADTYQLFPIKPKTRIPYGLNVLSVAFNSDGTQLHITGHNFNGDSSASTYNSSNGKSLFNLSQPNNDTDVILDHSGHRVAFLSGATVGLWSLNTGKKLADLKHQGKVTKAIFTNDDQYIVTSSRDMTTRVWSTKTFSEIARVEHDDKFFADFSISPDGNFLSTENSKGVKGNVGRIRIWSIKDSPSPPRSLGKYALFCAISSDSKLIVTSNYGFISIWDISTLKKLHQFNIDGIAGEVIFSSDSKYLAAAGGQEDSVLIKKEKRLKNAYIWDTSSGREVIRMNQSGIVNALSFSRDSRKIATAGMDGLIQARDLKTGAIIFNKPQESPVVSVAFSPDGKYIGTSIESIGEQPWPSSMPSKTRVWDIGTQKEIVNFESHSPARVLKFSPDSRFLAASDGNFLLTNKNIRDTKSLVNDGGDGFINILDIKNGKQFGRLDTIGDVYDIDFCSDGTRLATVGEHSTYLWDVFKGSVLARMSQDFPTNRVEFSPDQEGKFFASASMDGYIRIWDGKTGREIRRITMGEVNDVSFSEDGKYLVATNKTSGATQRKLWNPDSLVEESCSRLTRNLDSSEWQKYFGEEDYRSTCPNLPADDLWIYHEEGKHDTPGTEYGSEPWYYNSFKWVILVYFIRILSWALSMLSRRMRPRPQPSDGKSKEIP